MARYKMRQRLISIGEDYVIEDERGQPVYKVDGKVLRIRETFVMEDMGGREVATIREKKLAIRDSMKILRDGKTVAEVSKKWFALRDTYGIDIAEGEDDALILAVAVALDEMAHDPDEGKG